jgi:hypothetical protein
MTCGRSMVCQWLAAGLWFVNDLRQVGGLSMTCGRSVVCQWLPAGRWFSPGLTAGRRFSPGTPVSSINKTDRHDITETLLREALNTITISITAMKWREQYKAFQYISGCLSIYDMRGKCISNCVLFNLIVAESHFAHLSISKIRCTCSSRFGLLKLCLVIVCCHVSSILKTCQINVRKPKGQSRMDNPEILVTLGIQDAGNTQWQHWGHKTKKKRTKNKTHTQHNTRNNGPTKHRLWTQMLEKAKQSMPLIRHPPCYL